MASPLLLLAMATMISGLSANSVCYGDGNKRRCFSDGPPFKGWPMPKNPYGEIAPIYHWIRESINNSRVINSSREMNLTDGLVVLIHGWMGDFPNTALWNRPIIENLIAVMPTTDILFVDWAKGAALYWTSNPYDQPASNTRSIAAALTDFLLDNDNFSASNSHCIGFSLGSHVCGFAGKRLKAVGASRSGWGRLTALDPANPNFNVDDPTTRVDKSDAEYVDVIHTSRLGLSRSVGHVDFFVSGGDHQPGCSRFSGRRRKRNIVRNLLTGIEKSLACSHERAPLIFASTILHQPSYDLQGVISDYYLPGQCTFSHFCPCPSLSDYNKGRCRTCQPQDGQIVGYWSFKRPNLGNFYGELLANEPYCIYV